MEVEGGPGPLHEGAPTTRLLRVLFIKNHTCTRNKATEGEHKRLSPTQSFCLIQARLRGAPQISM